MGLKIKLCPGEKVYLNGVLVENGKTPCSLQVLNRATVLREKDILLEQEADTPCKRLYFVIQSLYFSREGEAEILQVVSKMSIEIVRAAPSTAGYLEQMFQHISESKHYAALKTVKELIKYEAHLISHAKSA